MTTQQPKPESGELDELRGRLAAEYVDNSKSDCCGTSDILIAEGQAFQAGFDAAARQVEELRAEIERLFLDREHLQKCLNEHMALLSLCKSERDEFEARMERAEKDLETEPPMWFAKNKRLTKELADEKKANAWQVKIIEQWQEREAAARALASGRNTDANEAIEKNVQLKAQAERLADALDRIAKRKHANEVTPSWTIAEEAIQQYRSGGGE